MKLDHLEEFIKMGREQSFADRGMKIALDGVGRAKAALESNNVDEAKAILDRLSKALARAEVQRTR